jgi:hypothetical protein
MNGSMAPIRRSLLSYAATTRSRGRFAALAADLANLDLAPPRNEAQSGYLLPPQQAELLARARMAA